METRKVTKKTENLPVKIKYESKSAIYANQFIINQSPEEIFLDLSSGPIPDPATGQTMIPIHTRVALSYAGAERLGTLLIKAAKNHALRVQAKGDKKAPKPK